MVRSAIRWSLLIGVVLTLASCARLGPLHQRNLPEGGGSARAASASPVAPSAPASPQLPVGPASSAPINEPPQPPPSQPAPVAAAVPMPAVESQPATASSPAVPFDAAILRAAERVVSEGVDELQKENSSLPRLLVIDPLIDASTGQQTLASQHMGQRIAGFIQLRHGDTLQVVPFTRANLEKTPILLIGTLTAVNAKNDPQSRNDSYRIWLTLIDLANGKIIGKALDRATEETVDATPSPLYRDSPTWSRDTAVSAYVESCQANTKLGDQARPQYLRSLNTAAVIHAATTAYEADRIEEANKLYREAAATPGTEDQLRVLVGLYLTHWRLGQIEQAEDVFGRIVAHGFGQKKLGIKFLFRPNATAFIDDRGISAQYPLWVRQIARRASPESVCMRVVGHTSKTGAAAVNERISHERAARVQSMLMQQDATLRPRLVANGVGFKENLIGSGTDDARDALDRRVEFNVVDCPVRAD